LLNLGNCEWVTAIESISASRWALPPTLSYQLLALRTSISSVRKAIHWWNTFLLEPAKAFLSDAHPFVLNSISASRWALPPTLSYQLLALRTSNIIKLVLNRFRSSVRKAIHWWNTFLLEPAKAFLSDAHPFVLNSKRQSYGSLTDMEAIQ
jgi:uncharacterized protein YqcC (DUF446 family)